MEESLQKLLYDAYRRLDAHVALEDLSGRKTTYGALLERALDLKEKLQAGGVKKGDRVAILLKDRKTWTESILSVWFAGAVAVLIDHRLSQRERQMVLKHCQAKLLLSDDKAYPQIAACLWGRKSVSTEIIYGKSNDAVLISYGGRILGQPRGAVITHEALLLQVRELLRRGFLQNKERIVNYLPLHLPVQVTICLLLLPLVDGVCLYKRRIAYEPTEALMQKMAPTMILEKTKGLKALCRSIRKWELEMGFFGRLAAKGICKFNRLLAGWGLQKYSVRPLQGIFGKSLRHICIVSSNHNLPLARNLQKMGYEVSLGLAPAHAAGFLTLNDRQSLPVEHVGRPMPGVHLRLQHCNGEGIGEIIAGGRAVAMHYFREEAMPAYGWLKSHSVGSFDKSCALHLFGKRQCYTLTTKGEPLVPEKIECAFESIPRCEEFAVFSRSFLWPKQGDDCLTLILRPNPDLDLKHLLMNVEARNRLLPEKMRISSYLVWPEKFPRTSTLQLKRHELADIISSRLTPVHCRPV